MTNDEQVVIDTLEHHATLWDASNPEQAAAFRDAAAVLREHADRTVVPEAAPPFPPTQAPVPEPVRTPDPNDQGAPTNG